MSVSSGDIILASDYNVLADNMNEYWADNYPSNTPSSSKSENSRGWGQVPVSFVNIGDSITATVVNHVVNRNNMAVTQTGVGSSISKVSVGALIDANPPYNDLETNNTNILSNCNVCVNATITSGGAAGTKDRTSSWTNSIEVTVTTTFNSYQEARYFFNSGGQLRYSFSNNGTTDDALAWQDLFDGDDMGTLIFSINDVSQTGTRAGTVTSGSGFYELTETETQFYSIQVDQSPYTDDDLKMYCSRNSDGTQVIVKFVLNNDDSNAETVDGTTTIYLDTRKADDQSSTDPTVTFSITAPNNVISDWSGS